MSELGKRIRLHRQLFPGSRSALLLMSLFLLLAIYPWLEHEEANLATTGARLAKLMLHVFLTFTLIGGAWLVHDRKNNLLVACILGLPWLMLGWTEQISGRIAWMHAVGIFSLVAFIFFVALSQVGFILRSPRATTDVLLRALSVYLLLGVAWTAMYGLADLLNPRAFQSNGGALHGPSGTIGWSDLLYYSFSTLSTLGIGDIVPASSYARSLTILECIIGPLYLAVLIARLVAMYEHDRRSKA